MLHFFHVTNRKQKSPSLLDEPFVEMAGVEPASKTLLNKATTLISGVRCFMNRCYTCKVRFTIPLCFTRLPFQAKAVGAYLREPKLKRWLCHPVASE